MWHLHIQREPGRRAPTSCTGCGSCTKTRSSHRSSVRRFSSVVSRKTSTSWGVTPSGSPCNALWSFFVTAKNASPTAIPSQRPSIPPFPRHRHRQLPLAEGTLEPAREVVVLHAIAQPGLEQVIGDRGVAHGREGLGELGQAGCALADRQHERDRIHEVKLFPGRRRAQRL